MIRRYMIVFKTKILFSNAGGGVKKVLGHQEGGLEKLQLHKRGGQKSFDMSK